MAVPTRIELAIFSVTGRHVNRYTTGPFIKTDYVLTSLNPQFNVLYQNKLLYLSFSFHLLASSEGFEPPQNLGSQPSALSTELRGYMVVLPGVEPRFDPYKGPALTIELRDYFGNGDRIRTYASQSQSLLSYRLTTPLFFNFYYIYILTYFFIKIKFFGTPEGIRTLT